VNTENLRVLIRQQREAGYSTILLSVDDVESMLIEVDAFRNHYDAATRRQKDGGRPRKETPPKITLENADRLDADPGGS
jgi:hypothetical protein